MPSPRIGWLCVFFASLVGCGGGGPADGSADASAPGSTDAAAAPDRGQDAAIGATDGPRDGAGPHAEAGAADAGCVPDDAADCKGKCGDVHGRCGGLVACGGCPVGEACGGGGQANVCATGTCTPSCSGKACGASDGCNGVCTDGACGQGERCVSGVCQCDATSCAGCCSGTTCQPGDAAAACGKGGAACQACTAGEACGTGACGTCGGSGQPCCSGSTCSPPLSCGGGGHAGVCGCTPDCNGKACGADDGCGGTCTAGSCASGQRCVSGLCECDTTSCSGCCSGNQCEPGTSDQACGKGGATCTTCSAGTTCGSASCGACGGAGQACCAGSTCASPLTCGGGGHAGVCGCTPQCSGKACGAGDGCGGTCAGAWTSETVATGVAWLQQASMVLDHAGNLQIVYWEQDASGGTGSLMHAYKANGAWTKSTILPSVDSEANGLAVDAAGSLHLVFAGKHYVFANGTWTAVDSYCAPGDSCDSTAAAVAVAADGSVHVAYYPNDATKVVRYAVHTASGWSFETVDPNGPTYDVYDDGIAIGFLPGGVPAVGYVGPTSVNFASRSAGTWTVEHVQPTPGDYSDVSMEIDPAGGGVRMTYDVGYGAGAYAVRSNGAWSTTPLSGWGVLPGGSFPVPARIAWDAYTNVGSPVPVVLLTQGASGSFTSETVLATPGNSSVNAALVQGSGASGTIWVLLRGYLQMTLYSRCASP